MLHSTIAATIGKLVATAAVIGISAGGIYVAARSARDGGDGAPLQETPLVVLTPPADGTAVPGLSGSTTATSPSGLTETGYTAPDGRPLYAECIQPGLPLPPRIPTPIGTAEPFPTTTPGPANAGKPTPADLPRFDLLQVQPAQPSDWGEYVSRCYGYALRLPHGWEAGNFMQSGYQQGESATFVSPDRSVKMDIYTSWSPYVGMDSRLRTPLLGEDGYLLEPPTLMTLAGRPAVRSYYFIGSPQPASILRYGVHLRDDWYLDFTIVFFASASPDAASEALGVIESLEVR